MLLVVDSLGVDILIISLHVGLVLIESLFVLLLKKFHLPLIVNDELSFLDLGLTLLALGSIKLFM